MLEEPDHSRRPLILLLWPIQKLISSPVQVIYCRWRHASRAPRVQFERKKSLAKFSGSGGRSAGRSVGQSMWKLLNLLLLRIVSLASAIEISGLFQKRINGSDKMEKKAHWCTHIHTGFGLNEPRDRGITLPTHQKQQKLGLSSPKRCLSPRAREREGGRERHSLAKRIKAWQTTTWKAAR